MARGVVVEGGLVVEEVVERYRKTKWAGRSGGKGPKKNTEDVTEGAQKAEDRSTESTRDVRRRDLHGPYGGGGIDGVGADHVATAGQFGEDAGE